MNTSFFYLLLASLCLILAVVLGMRAKQQRKKSGMPGGKIMYADTGKWQPVESPLYDPVLGITGKPDYLVAQGKYIIPVEVKSGRTPDAPYDSHIYQIAVYCALVEKEYQQTPPYGILKYPERTYQIDNTPELQESLLTLLEEMRRDSRKRNVPRSHEAAARCSNCGYRHECDQALM